MAATVKFTFFGTITGNDGVEIPFGDEDVRTTITLGTGLTFYKMVSVAQNTTKTIFDATSDLADFDFLLVVSDQDLYVEETADQNASFGTMNMAKKILAGIPYVLGTNIAYANYTVNFGGGTIDVIDRLRVRNLGATTANVTVLAAT